MFPFSVVEESQSSSPVSSVQHVYKDTQMLLIYTYIHFSVSYFGGNIENNMNAPKYGNGRITSSY